MPLTLPEAELANLLPAKDGAELVAVAADVLLACAKPRSAVRVSMFVSCVAAVKEQDPQSVLANRSVPQSTQVKQSTLRQAKTFVEGMN